MTQSGLHKMGLRLLYSDGLVVKFLLFLLLVCKNTSLGLNLTIIHTNDIHSHVEEMNKYSGKCSSTDAQNGNCFGGISRRVTKVLELRRQFANSSLLLDAGDQFQGTQWFNIYNGLVSSAFMNRLGYDAMSLGNHEFDKGPDVLKTFLGNLTFPVVCSNINVTMDLGMKSLIRKSIVVSMDNRKIAVVGYLTTETLKGSSPGPNITFDDILTSVREEVNRLKQEENINIFIGLGHHGYKEDITLATEIEDIDLLIGGHSHTFLFSGDNAPDHPEGPYPTVVNRTNGPPALVVQSFWSGKYLGMLHVLFDQDGNLQEWNGSPILLDNSVLKDLNTESEVAKLKGPLEEARKLKVGETAVFLQGDRRVCRLDECNLGNMITDAWVSFHLLPNNPSDWTYSAIAILNAGGIRSSIEKGAVTLENVIETQPFGNTIDIIAIRGKHLRNALEHSVYEYDVKDPQGRFLQMAGLRVVYDLCREPGSRVVSVLARCQNCTIPTYLPLEEEELYNVITLSFLIKGGDGFDFGNHIEKWERRNQLDVDVLVKYLKSHQPLAAETKGRISFLHKPCLPLETHCSPVTCPNSTETTTDPSHTTKTTVSFCIGAASLTSFNYLLSMLTISCIIFFHKNF